MTTPEFLGLPFAPLGPTELDPRLTDLLGANPQPLSDYCCCSLFAWSQVYRYHFALPEPGTLLLMSWPRDQAPRLLQPIGRCSVELQRWLLEQGACLPEPLRIESVSARFLEEQPDFVRHFAVEAIRDSANYIYATADLAELQGHRYAKKRNLIAQARSLYTWTGEPLGPHHRQECLEIREDIAAERTAAAGVTLEDETAALEAALRGFALTHLRGLLLRIAGQRAAFSIYAGLGSTTAVVLFERALRIYKGLYQVINQETARLIAAEGFTEINREEDLGDPGLRQAKLSYHPLRLEPKHLLTLTHSGR